MSDGEHCRVHLRVRAETGFGQTVAIGGNSNALGGFHLSKVVELVTTPESYPVWYTQSPIVLPTNRVVEYKYGIVEGGFCKSFEPGACRSMTAAEFETVVEDKLTNFYATSQGHDSEVDLMNEMNLLTANSGQQDMDNVRALGGRLIIVCYHLPVKVTRTNAGSFKVVWAESLIAQSKDDSIARDTDTSWVGTLSVPGGNASMTAAERADLTEILAAMKCFPIFLEERLHHAFYKVYCKQVMWPVYHNVDQLDHMHAAWRMGDDAPMKNADGEPELGWQEQSGSYTAYMAVNNIFLEMLRDMMEPNDIIWVHDYHLTLLPKLIRTHLKVVQEAAEAAERGKTEATANGEGGAGEEGGGKAAKAKAVIAPYGDVHIVFFLHIPFPTSQIFRSLPNASDLLESMICADVVGFHAFDYTRHFINACKRVLGIRSKHRPGGLLSLTVGDHDVIVTMSVVSIEAALVQQAVDSNEAKLIAANLRSKYSGKKIIVGVDVLNRLSGLGLKMGSFERLLKDMVEGGADGRKKRSASHDLGRSLSASSIKSNCEPQVVLLQKAIRNGARPMDEELTSSEVCAKAAAMNAAFGCEVVDYEEVSSMTLAQRVGLWLASDIFFLTSIREGLNLYPHEFIYSRKDVPNAGVVVASEFSACSTLLNGALKVNPFNMESVADTLDKALQMDTQERDRRRHRDLKFVSTKTSSKWTRQILSEIHGLQRSKNLSNMAKMSGTTSSDMLQQMVASPTKSISGVNTTSLMPLLTDVDVILDSYAASKLSSASLPERARRVFILDYGGTLLNKERYDIYIKQSLSAISGRKPTPRMMAAIRKLCADPCNAVMVITGLTRLKMGNVFEDFPNLSLATSNGLVYYWGQNMLRESENDMLCEENANRAEAKWQTMGYDIDWDEVKKVAVPIMTRFVFRTNGTCLTPRIPGIGWSYFGSDPDWGEKQAAQLEVELEASLANFDVKIVSQIQGSIEIVPKSLSKGVMVKQFMERVLERRAGVLPAFTTVIGDDTGDDVMYEALYNIIANAGPGSRPKNMRNFTVVVGKRVSPADLYLNDVLDVENLLDCLAHDRSTGDVEEPMQHVISKVVN